MRELTLGDDDEPEDLNDELPIFVTLNFDVHQCDCCGKDNLKRTVRLEVPGGGLVHLGVICAGRWFKMNLTGNPYYAADRLAKKVRELDNSNVENTLADIKKAATEWEE